VCVERRKREADRLVGAVRRSRPSADRR
jgi:hypothetical protein